MSQMVIEYQTLALSQQVLERQVAHAQRLASYLPANADIGDSTALGRGRRGGQPGGARAR